MSDLANFADLANVKGNEVEKPKPLPAGHYQAIITGLFKPHKAKSGNQAMRFPIRLVAPMDDVDAEALAAAGGIPDKEYTIDFWMSPDARWRFTEFAKAMGISDDLNLLEMAEQLAQANTPFQIEGTHSPNERDPESPFFRLDNPAPLAG